MACVAGNQIPLLASDDAKGRTQMSGGIEMATYSEAIIWDKGCVGAAGGITLLVHPSQELDKLCPPCLQTRILIGWLCTESCDLFPLHPG